MEKYTLKTAESIPVGETECLDFKLQLFFQLISQGLPWKLEGDIVEDSIFEGGTKSEPTSPTSCSSQSPWRPIEDSDISVTFPDLKLVYQKTQSRANRQSRQRVENGKIKIRVYTAGPQVQSIEVYVERTPDAAVLVGDRCGRVSLKSQPGKYLPHQHFFTVDLDSIYESPTKHGVPVYKLSTVDSQRRNKFRLVVIVILIDDTRSKEFISPSFRLRSKPGGRFRSLSL